MKKTLLTISMMLTIALTTAFANDNEKIDQKAKASFNNSFRGTNNVLWQQEKDFVKATFTMNNQVMYAYYNDNGDLMAVTRNILSDQLPITLMTDLKKNYNDHWISDLFEMAAEGQTSYYITLENADETIILKSSDFNTWSVYKKTKRA
jgi:hypothetical protein